MIKKIVNIFNPKADKNDEQKKQAKIYTSRESDEEYNTVQRNNKSVLELKKEMEKRLKKNSRHPEYRICLVNKTKKGDHQVSKRVLNNWEKIFNIIDKHNLENTNIKFTFEDLNDYNIMSGHNNSQFDEFIIDTAIVFPKKSFVSKVCVKIVEFLDKFHSNSAFF